MTPVDQVKRAVFLSVDGHAHPHPRDSLQADIIKMNSTPASCVLRWDIKSHSRESILKLSGRKGSPYSPSERRKSITRYPNSWSTTKAPNDRAPFKIYERSPNCIGEKIRMWACSFMCDPFITINISSTCNLIIVLRMIDRANTLFYWCEVQYWMIEQKYFLLRDNTTVNENVSSKW